MNVNSVRLRSRLLRRIVVSALIAVVASGAIALARPTASQPTASPSTTSATAASTATEHSATTSPKIKLVSYPTYCWTYSVVMWHYNVYAKVIIPFCFNGYNVWPNGGVTGLAGGYGVSVSVGWAGTYNSSSRTWLGFGENIYVSYLFGSYSCAPRWYINTDGQLYGGNMNC